MLLAGLSEFVIMGAILYALIALPKNSPAMDSIYKLALLITLFASTLGAIKFLSDLDISKYHQIFTFISKHVAVTAFIICAGWPLFRTKATQILAVSILISTLVSLIINLFTELSLLSMGIMIFALGFTIYSMKENKTAMLYLSLATGLLLSTLFWGAFIKDLDTMIGVYHLCVGGFYLLAALSFKTKNGASL